MLKSRYFMKINWNIFQEKRCLYCLQPFTPTPKSTLLDNHIHQFLCPTCATYLVQRKTGYCKTCGQLLNDPQYIYQECGVCRNTNILWDSFLFYGKYNSLLRELIKKAKFHHNRAAIKFLGELLALLFYENHHQDFSPFYSLDIVPMPLHKKRLHNRGYNQCLELAKMFTKKLKTLAPQIHINLHYHYLQKSRYTIPQSSLERKERLTNTKNSFQTNNDNLEKILLIDDIATTNSTLKEVCKTLKKSNIKSIDVLVIAKA